MSRAATQQPIVVKPQNDICTVLLAIGLIAVVIGLAAVFLRAAAVFPAGEGLL